MFTGSAPCGASPTLQRYARLMQTESKILNQKVKEKDKEHSYIVRLAKLWEKIKNLERRQKNSHVPPS